MSNRCPRCAVPMDGLHHQDLHPAATKCPGCGCADEMMLNPYLVLPELAPEEGDLR
jgi:hypothetical protein